MADDNLAIKIERLEGVLGRVRDDMADLRRLHARVERLNGEIDRLVAETRTTREIADGNRRRIEAREREREDELRARQIVAKWAQFAISVVMVIAAGWSGLIRTALEQARIMLSGFGK